MILDIVSAFVAYGVSAYSFTLNRYVGKFPLKALGLGFSLLGTGLLLEGTTGLIADAMVGNGLLAKRLVSDSGVLFLSLQLVAYLFFALAYGSEMTGRGKVLTEAEIDSSRFWPIGALAATFGGLYDVALTAYLVMVALLMFVTFGALLAHGRSRSRSTLLVLLGFGLVLSGHVLMLESVATLTPGTFYAGTLVQFTGFVSLLWFLVRSGRLGAK